MKRFLIFLFVSNFCLFNLYWITSTPKKLKVLGCLRTKDSKKYMHEFFTYHLSRGITHFEVFDDSTEAMKLDYPWVTYHYVNGKKLKNEQDDVEKCFRNAITNGEFDYVMNLDDDEYLFGNHEFKKFEHRCMYLPIVYYGSIKSYNTGFTPIDFVHRDKIVKTDNKHYLKNSAYGLSTKFYYHPNKRTYKVKKRITKAIFKIPTNVSERYRMLRDLSINKRSGAYIHGNGMACDYDNYSYIGHYTRSNDDLQIRIKEFWKSIKGLSSRFSDETKVQNYIKERNRTDEVDLTLHHLASKVFLKHIQPN